MGHHQILRLCAWLQTSINEHKQFCDNTYSAGPLWSRVDDLAIASLSGMSQNESFALLHSIETDSRFQARVLDVLVNFVETPRAAWLDSLGSATEKHAFGTLWTSPELVSCMTTLLLPSSVETMWAQFYDADVLYLESRSAQSSPRSRLCLSLSDGLSGFLTHSQTPIKHGGSVRLRKSGSETSIMRILLTPRKLRKPKSPTLGQH